LTQARNKLVKQAKAICRRDGQGTAFEVALQQALARHEEDIEDCAADLRGPDDGALDSSAQDMADLLMEQIEWLLKYDEARHEDGAPPPAGKKKTISVTPPEWWESYSRRMVGLLNDLQRKALHALNTPHDLGRGPPYTEFFGEALPRKRTGEPSLLMPHEPLRPEDFISPEQLGEFVRWLAERYEGEGPQRVFEWLDDAGKKDGIVIYQGYWEKDLRQGGVWNPQLPFNPLWEVVGLADNVVDRTGCRHFEAVSFLLCNRPFLLPWLQAKWDLSATPPGGQIEIKAHPFVPLAQVFELYREAWEKFREHTRGREALRACAKLTKPRSSTLRLLDFVEDKRPPDGKKIPWSEVHRLWNAEEQHRYTTEGSMRQSYHRARRDLEGERTNPNEEFQAIKGRGHV